MLLVLVLSDLIWRIFYRELLGLGCLDGRQAVGEAAHGVLWLHVAIALLLAKWIFLRRIALLQILDFG
jgi:hypothetical protein